MRCSCCGRYFVAPEPLFCSRCGKPLGDTKSLLKRAVEEHESRKICRQSGAAAGAESSQYAIILISASKGAS